MNKRIQELAEEAASYASRETSDLDEWQFIRDEKFTQLIVQECLDIVEPDVGMVCGDEWYTTLKGTAQEIREHFGIEE